MIFGEANVSLEIFLELYALIIVDEAEDLFVEKKFN